MGEYKRRRRGGRVPSPRTTLTPSPQHLTPNTPLTSMSPTAFILGAGGHVGLAVANKLKQEGYKVAVGSRKPLQKEGLVPITVDVSDTDSVTKAFAEVKEKLGAAPNVVVFNGSSILSHILTLKKKGPIIHTFSFFVYSRRFCFTQSPRRPRYGRTLRRQRCSGHHRRIIRFHPTSRRRIQISASRRFGLQHFHLYGKQDPFPPSRCAVVEPLQSWFAKGRRSVPC